MPRQRTDLISQGAQLVPQRGQFGGPSQLGLGILRVAADEEGVLLVVLWNQYSVLDDGFGKPYQRT